MKNIFKRKDKIEKQMTQDIIFEIESAIKSLKDNEKLFEKTRFRQEDVSTLYNNEQLVKFKLNCLVSNLKKSH